MLKKNLTITIILKFKKIKMNKIKLKIFSKKTRFNSKAKREI